MIGFCSNNRVVIFVKQKKNIYLRKHVAKTQYIYDVYIKDGGGEGVGGGLKTCLQNFLF